MTDPKLTPREPTPSMVEAGLVWTDFARGVWRAMHDAAPKVEAEPVAWMDDFGNAFPLAANKGAGSWLDEHKRNWKPLYTHPAAPQPDALPDLSDAEIGRLVDRMDNTHDSDLLKFARAVIAAMKGKQ
ncbi:MAG: hypothetical protein KAY56_11525 [Inhella sp.]|nr:hypothetical protein [Inhella sp.]